LIESLDSANCTLSRVTTLKKGMAMETREPDESQEQSSDEAVNAEL